MTIDQETHRSLELPESSAVPIAARPCRHPADRVSAIALASLFAIMLVMLARVIQLQTRPSDELRPFISERVTTMTLKSVQGDIQDRRGLTLAGTRFGRRVFVDPQEFLKAPPDAIPRLADAIGEPVAKLATRLAPRMETTRRRIDAIDDQNPETTPDGKPIRYVTVGGVLEDWREQAVLALDFPGVHLESVPVRALTAERAAAPLVGMVGVDHNGLVGAEKLIEPLIQPGEGVYRYVRDAYGQPMWVFSGGYVPPQRGRDVRLSIDSEVQRIATEELARGVLDADAAGGRCVVLDPRTGEVLAMVDLLREVHGLTDYDWQTIIPKTGLPGVRFRTIKPDPKREDFPQIARNRCIEDVYEPGSTFKSFMWAATTELGLCRTTEIFNTHGGRWTTPYGRSVNDVTRRDSQSWADVLINSSNIGMAQGTSRMSFQQMHDAVVRFGFGSRTNIGLPGESPGIVIKSKAWTKYDQTSVAMGHSVAVTPIQMVRGYANFARTGDMAGTIPPITFLAVDPETAARGVQGRRVLTQQIADLTRETMRGVTHNLDTRIAQNDPEATHFRYEAFGKSGTAEIPLGDPPKGKRRPKGSDGYFRGQYNSSFIAGAPVEVPRVVVLVVIDDPGPSLIARKLHYGSATAGPVNRRIIERSLAYLAVPPTQPASDISQVDTASAD